MSDGCAICGGDYLEYDECVGGELLGADAEDEAKLRKMERDEARRRRERCPDCGKRGERKGHQDCQYPQD